MTKGYKVFNPDWTCRNKQYTCPGEFEEDVTPVECESGMHFCEDPADCFRCYDFNPENHVCEVEAYGDIDRGANKVCTNKLRVIREIPWDEVLRLVNTGKDCTGLCNTGDCNTGDRNTGNRNTGNWNTGNWNTGDCNTGDRNTGNRNTGDWNTGDRNTGDCNTGDWNTGDRNTGDRNTGDSNTGDRNTGDRNTGNWNTGNWNTGDRNTGNWNTGDWNTGNWNTGDRNTGNWNTGDWNAASFSSGCFCTGDQKILMFDKPSEWTLSNWWCSNARRLMNNIRKDVVEWVYTENMSEEEKEKHPEHKTIGGYLKALDESECAQIWWDGLNQTHRQIIMDLPNFDAEIFRKCTGIKV